MSTNHARHENTKALQGSTNKTDLADLDSFQFYPDHTAEFLTRMQKQVPILDMVTTTVLPRLEMQTAKFGVPRLSGNTRDEGGTRTDGTSAETGNFKFNATDKSYYILFEPERDALKNTPVDIDSWGDLIINEFTQRWANDVGIIGMRGSVSDASENLESITGTADLDTTFTGWIARAEGEEGTFEDASTDDRLALEDTDAADVSEMPSYDNTSDPIDTTTFNESIQTLDSRYRDPENFVFLVNPDQVQQYAFDLTQREDPLGSAVIFGDSELTPFDYDIVGVPEWPTSYGMLTDPENLAFGLFEEMSLDQTTNSDKVNENRLHSRNWLEGQMDFQIRSMQAGVLIENLADPLA